MDTKDNLLPVWLHGCTGRMGHEVRAALQQPSSRFTLMGGSAENFLGIFKNGELAQASYQEAIAVLKTCRLVIDFSAPQGNKTLYDFFQKENIQELAVLVATTGLSEEEKSLWRDLIEPQKLKVMFAPNTSFGVLLVTKVCKQIAEALRGLDFDIELIETHHRNKLDSPSGTGKFIAAQIAAQEELELTFTRLGKRSKNELGVFGLRGGAVFGEHTIKFLGDFEEIEVTHKALSRSLFAKGALLIGSWLDKQSYGMYGLEDFH
jgi:4-hydroxy-tetrahydrodipicolinate reductase